MPKAFERSRAEKRLYDWRSTSAPIATPFSPPGVKEAQVRQSLIDPLFEALCWDVTNKALIVSQYREVVIEESVDVEEQRKAPDYTFRIGMRAKFYAEAKKCDVNIAADPGPVYQLRRYGWSAKVALSILTDVEELGVYHCSLRPDVSDKASRGRILFLHFEEYPERWRKLWNIFSRDALRAAIRRQKAAELEQRHRRGYELHPLRADEFRVWETEQNWGDE